MIGRLPLYLLLFGCVILGAILFEQITRPDSALPIATEIAAPPDAAPAAPPMPRIRASAEPVAAVLARPLFSPTRRPPQANVANTGDASGLDETRLTGIVIAPGEHLAIFAPSDAALLTVTEGGSVSGWRVDSITPREVSLSGPDGTKTLEPKFDPNLAPAAPTDAQPPPQLPQPVVGVGGRHPPMQRAPGVAIPRPGQPIFTGPARLRQLRQR